ncbi:MAG: hypothetical protein HFJ89_01480 [Oscillospiraceae bacterium]|nr:hypothetical protein [Oscillospiraceae bacterium]
MDDINKPVKSNLVNEIDELLNNVAEIAEEPIYENNKKYIIMNKRSNNL